jgi:hypothetical protein
MEELKRTIAVLEQQLNNDNKENNNYSIMDNMTTTYKAINAMEEKMKEKMKKLEEKMTTKIDTSSNTCADRMSELFGNMTLFFKDNQEEQEKRATVKIDNIEENQKIMMAT